MFTTSIYTRVCVEHCYCFMGLVHAYKCVQSVGHSALFLGRCNFLFVPMTTTGDSNDGHVQMVTYNHHGLRLITCSINPVLRLCSHSSVWDTASIPCIHRLRQLQHNHG